MVITGWGQDCDVPVCMSIQSVNTGTLDIFMINQAGCSYGEGSAQIFDTSMDVAGCENMEGTWFNGEVAGFQFNIVMKCNFMKSEALKGLRNRKV